VMLKKWSSIRVWDNRKKYDEMGKTKREDQPPEVVGRIVDIRPRDNYVICTLDTGYNVSFSVESFEELKE